MAGGDFTLFHQFAVDRDEKVHNLETDDIKVGLISGTPTAADAGPHFNGTGTTDESATEVTPGATSPPSYVAGGASATGPSVTLTATKSVFDADDITWALDANGPTDCRFAIVYNNTDANKRAIGFIDLGENLSLQSAAIELQFNAGGLFSTELVASA